ncbi:hypothetical protein [Phytoactinopolyspora halotolerans]|uniref:Uncharacterized protein n=1 Tax=Phytoactinopolyspora halotolerans TaxID=1981512 RepID=A0A6L9S8Y3_9ACTN|nr:hypothetical protein [Phytoactinopolyspora halotolerans]NEE01527.1 hypothetical protein [Phytoactinopolyspora halotolerans]
MRVGRDVHDKLKSRVQSGLKLAPGERIELMVRLNGRKPEADCLVITNARVIALESVVEPLTWVRRQALADEIRTWRLSRKFRSRLTITTGYGRTDVFGSSLSLYDDDLVDEQMAALVSGRSTADTISVIKALRAEAHWMSSVYGRSVYVLDRAAVPSATAEAIDLDMVERQLSHFDYWPSSEVRRHLAVCLLVGGCWFANTEVAAGEMTGPAPIEKAHVKAVSDALITVDTAKIKKGGGREGEVLTQLMSVVAHIRATPGWRSPHLDENELRIDLDDEVRHIALGCYRVAELRMEIGGKPDARSETGRRAATVHDTSMLSLDVVVRRLEDRVDTLASYRDRLRTLSRELADLDDATRVAGVAEKVAQLAASTMNVDDPGGSLAELLPSPRDSADAVPDVLDALRGDVERLRHPDSQLVS